MAQVSQRYLDGIREGRESFTLLCSFFIGLTGHKRAEAIQRQIDTLVSFRGKMAQLAYSSDNVEYVDGQIDFMKNQARRLFAQGVAP